MATIGPGGIAARIHQQNVARDVADVSTDESRVAATATQGSEKAKESKVSDDLDARTMALFGMREAQEAATIDQHEARDVADEAVHARGTKDLKNKDDKEAADAAAAEGTETQHAIVHGTTDDHEGIEVEVKVDHATQAELDRLENDASLDRLYEGFSDEQINAAEAYLSGRLDSNEGEVVRLKDAPKEIALATSKIIPDPAESREVAAQPMGLQELDGGNLLKRVLPGLPDNEQAIRLPDPLRGLGEASLPDKVTAKNVIPLAMGRTDEEALMEMAGPHAQAQMGRQTANVLH